MLHFGERKLCHDLIQNKILSSSYIDGILVEVTRSKKLFQFLQNHKTRGYPYFWVS